ncbi:Membrane lipoprotein TmpC [Clostridium felsineum]|uniref:Membrane lipoprotein TmpC n=2 Tax=Clostridium felsineum TaxID=36839 RepID=A0A1S8LJU8_9CLOT|nr:Membrane lipoprotein TmpC [Clostridium felsineum]URZ05418.1 Membrane lipoprotein TmpC [Clostridium felsineum]URZ10459.1 Membrane lipoprotein TmpC [Clostridium felsineum]URZ17615.1 Membrane lipoprotein TmpC [Clostridium felsineum DSM 794]
MKRKTIAILTTVVLLAGLFAGCSSSSSSTTKDSNKIKVGLSTDEGGLNDKSFNQGADEGIKKAAKEFNVDYKAIEAKKKDDYKPNLQSLIDNDSDLVFGVGYQMADDLADMAKKYPKKDFAIIDNAYDKQPSNVVSLVFKEQEGSFLVGVIAGKMTKTNKIGFVGGKDQPLINKFLAGYIAGAKTVNPNITVEKNFTNDFADTTKGKEVATSLYNGGCDIVYHAAGGAGIGVFDVAQSLKSQGKDVWAIGVDKDQAVGLPKYADVILTSMVKRVDIATYDTVKALAKDKKFNGGKIENFGLKENGVGVAPSSNKHVPSEILSLVDKYKQAIIDGKIVVPDTVDKAQTFKTDQIK